MSEFLGVSRQQQPLGMEYFSLSQRLAPELRVMTFAPGSAVRFLLKPWGFAMGLFGHAGFFGAGAVSPDSRVFLLACFIVRLLRFCANGPVSRCSAGLLDVTAAASREPFGASRRNLG